MSQLSPDVGKQMEAAGLEVTPCSDGQQVISRDACYQRHTNIGTPNKPTGQDRHPHPCKQNQCEWNGHKTWNGEDTAVKDSLRRRSVFGVARHRNPTVGISPFPTMAIGLRGPTYVQQT